jgi:hypothetical protein
VKKARRAQAPPPKPQRPPSRRLLFFGVLALVGLLAAGGLLWLTSDGDEETFSGVPAADPGPVHVHGLGVKAMEHVRELRRLRERLQECP